MKRVLPIILALALAGCAVAPPRLDYSLIDPKGVDSRKYEQDYSECAELANQTDVGDRAAGSAVAGAIIGAIIGGMICGRNCAGQVAGVSAASAAARGAGSGAQEQQHALRACLAGRGYRIIR